MVVAFQTHCLRQSNRERISDLFVACEIHRNVDRSSCPGIASSVVNRALQFVKSFQIGQTCLGVLIAEVATRYAIHRLHEPRLPADAYEAAKVDRSAS